MRGKLSVIGFGPGSIDYMTMKAIKAIEHADIVIGHTTYVDILRQPFPNKSYRAVDTMEELEEHCRIAVKDAQEGWNVAIGNSGDSGIYGIAGIIYQVAEEMDADVDIEVIPGITAAFAAASILGAPLMHDTALINLFDYNSLGHNPFPYRCGGGLGYGDMPLQS